jgi:hypothetical protein
VKRGDAISSLRKNHTAPDQHPDWDLIGLVLDVVSSLLECGLDFLL